MKAGIMQPYFLPYIGYWQLMNIVDKYVVYDDVNFINRGWINRNRILVNGKPHYINVWISEASQNKKINEISIIQDSKLVNKRMKMIEFAYKKAPYFNMACTVIEKILTCRSSNLAAFIENSFYIICDCLGIKTEFVISSSLNKTEDLKGQEKILDICEILGADEYYNSIGGQHLYSFDVFKSRGVDLRFLQTENIVYKQFDNEFQANLSIVDVMMFNSVEEIRKYLDRYIIIENQ